MRPDDHPEPSASDVAERDRLLTAAHALGLPVPDALVTAPLGAVRRAVRQRAEARLVAVEAQTATLERDRAVLAGLLTDASGDA
ncbi:MAG: hypothetical protein AAGI91_16490 [Bacteroidota bacterium]